jgi:hypothetical protein
MEHGFMPGSGPWGELPDTAGGSEPAGGWNGQRAGPGADLRASHADREQIVEVLRVAAGEGRLTGDELGERIQAALAARTYRELARLTADLPPAPGGPMAARPEEFSRIDCMGGCTRRFGAWVVPRVMEISVAGGAVHLDFTDAVISQPVLRIMAMVRDGLLFLGIRPDIEVDASKVRQAAGNVVIRPAAFRRPPVVLRVEISGENVAGWVVANRGQYPLWQ